MDGLWTTIYIQIFISSVITSSTGLIWNPQKFPLNDCLTSNIDIVVIADNFTHEYTDSKQTNFQYTFLQELLEIFMPKKENFGRIRIALVEPTEDEPVLKLGFHDSNTNPKQFLMEIPRIGTNDVKNLPEQWIPSTLDVARKVLAKEGRKDHVKHVIILAAVVNIDLEDIMKQLNDIVKQASSSSDVMLFTVLHEQPGSRKIREAEALPDTLHLPLMPHELDQRLNLALCQQCSERWMLHEHYGGVNELSCHAIASLWITDIITTLPEANSKCSKLYYGSTVSSLETKGEVRKIHLFIKSKVSLRNVGQTGVIGLEREVHSLQQRFVWMNGRPLIYPRWKTGMPRRTGINAEISCDGQHDNCGWIAGAKICYYASTFVQYIACEVCITSVQKAITISPPSQQTFRRIIDFIFSKEYHGDIDSQFLLNYTGPFMGKFMDCTTIACFYCSDDNYQPETIPYLFVCDHKVDCSNGRDESLCGYKQCHHTEEFRCRSGQCIPKEATCDAYSDCRDGSDEELCKECKMFSCPSDPSKCYPQSWLGDGEEDCPKASEFIEIIMLTNTYYKDRPFVEILPEDKYACPFICNRSKCVHITQLDDDFQDCTGPEGPLDETIGKLNWQKICQVDTEFHDKKIIHRWAPPCYYIKDRYGAVLGCRDMSHLHNCTDFVCTEGYVKCPDSYCIPIHYVRNGEMDCPFGEDEISAPFTNCSANFRCWNSTVCLHPDLVCDRHPHCPHGDDELECGLTCAEGFQCLGGALTVIDNTVSNTVANLSFLDHRTRYIHLSGVDLSSSFHEVSSRGRFESAFEVYLSRCKITNASGNFVTDLSKLETVYYMDASYNLFKEIPTHSMFAYMTNMRTLDLSHNKMLKSILKEGLHFRNKKYKLENLDLSYTGIEYIDDEMLMGFNILKVLNLSHTLITKLRDNMFADQYVLYFLDLRQAPITKFETRSLSRLTIRSGLYTDNALLCCSQVRGQNIPDHKCHAPTDAISSCSDLLSRSIHRVLIWIMGCMAISGNILVVIFRLMSDRQVLKRPYGIFVTNLSVSDLLMGIYLLVIAGVDLRFKGEYVWYDSDWRYGNLCKAAGFLSTLSSETSMFFISLITIDRFLVIKFPFGRHHFTSRGVFATTILAWIGGFSLAAIPVLPQFTHWAMYSSNGLCLGLPLTSARFPGWEYSTGVFVVLNFIMFVFIGCGQWSVYKAMTGNRTKVESPVLMSTRRVEEITVAKNLSLIVFTDFLCWFPIGVMGLMALNGHDVGQEAYAWSAVLVLPINSAINPILYTLPAIRAKWEKFKRGNFEISSNIDRAKKTQPGPRTDAAGPSSAVDTTGLGFICSNYICPECKGCPHDCYINSCPNFQLAIDSHRKERP